MACLLLLLLAACGGAIDAEEARLCRLVMPALNEGAALALDPARRGPFPLSLRIDYGVTAPAGGSASRFVICRFSASRNAKGQRELVGLATELGPMADASFFFLRRFYLDVPGAALDPAPPALGEDVPQVPYWLAYGAQQALVALPKAAIYALLAAAYALLYGLVGRIVLVFGEFAAVGSVAGIVGLGVFFTLGVETALAGVAIAFAIGVAASALHGFALSRAALTPLARAPGQHVLIATVGAGIAITEYLRIMQGAEMRWLPPVMNQPLPLLRAGEFVTTMTSGVLLAALAGLGSAAALLVYMRRSAYGRRWQAVADDPGCAALFGVDERAVHDRAVAIAAAIAGLAGLIVAVLYGGMGFAGGFTLGLKALMAAILGGIGSVPGAALGGLLLAMLEAVWSASMPIELRDLAVFAVLVLVLVFRPGGLMGYAELTPRRV